MDRGMLGIQSGTAKKGQDWGQLHLRQVASNNGWIYVLFFLGQTWLSHPDVQEARKTKRQGCPEKKNGLLKKERTSPLTLF